MINETLTEFMKKIEFNNEICFYKNKEKGIIYPLTPQHLLVRVEYLELDKNEVAKMIYEQKIDKKEYEMYTCVKPVPKIKISGNKNDINKLTDMEYKGTHIWNVVNQAGIHETFEDKDSAIKL